MDRRYALKTGLCLMAGLCMAGRQGPAKAGVKTPANADLRKRTFKMMLAPVVQASVSSRLKWLEMMQGRLGRDVTLRVWNEAFKEPDDGLAAMILSSGWQAYEDSAVADFSVKAMINSAFRESAGGISGAEALQLVMLDSCIRLATQTHAPLTVSKQITAFEALHLRLDGIARLATAMKDMLGKEGELLAYDFCRADRVAKDISDPAGREASAVLKEWAGMADAQEQSLFTAGLDMELIRQSDTEVVLHVTACEWARYFLERHPSVGYLVACSSDEAALKAANETLSLQRTSTIMEGAELCDFRVYLG
jgi:hypothetical protein